jgi:hypothetical protein
MEGASGVIALVLAETAAGGAAVLWLTPLWGSVKRGFFVLTTAVLAACVAAAAASASAARVPGGDADAAILLAWITAGVLALSLVALALRRLTAGRWLGLASVPLGIALLVSLAGLADPGLLPALVQLAAGAAFMGAATVGLLLGHWYLVDRGLDRAHIKRLALVLIGAVGVEVIALIVGGARGDVAPTEGFSPFLTVGGGAIYMTIVLGMVGITALIAVLIHFALREPRPRAVQAATGFFYLAVITAFTAELAAKVRFLG